jgi:hypothetical protein
LAIELDHLIVPTRSRVASARLLAELLGVSWAESAFGIFSPVYVNEGLTLDFIETQEPFEVHHYCFRVTQAEFGAILGRLKARKIPYRSQVRGPTDYKVDPEYGNVYWNEPDGHQWEILIRSYARARAAARG